MSKVKKPIPCRHYASSGTCFYGDQCQFMHVPLATVPFHNEMSQHAPLSHETPQPQPQAKPFTHAASFSGLGFTAGRGVPRLPPSNPIRVGGVASQNLSGMMNNLSLQPKQPVTAAANNVNPIPLVHPNFPMDPRHRPPSMDTAAAPPFRKSVPSQPMMIGPRMRMRAPNQLPTKTESVGGTTYFYRADNQSQYTPSHRSFNYTPTHVTRSKSGHHHSGSYFINDDQKQELLHRQMLAAARLPPESNNVPVEVECYHSLFPLEPESSPTPDKVNQSLFGYVSTCYKAVNTKNKSHCVLRRLHSYKLSSAKAVQEVHRWRKVTHVNVVALHEMFTTKVFGDNCKFPACCVYSTREI